MSPRLLRDDSFPVPFTDFEVVHHYLKVRREVALGTVQQMLDT